MTLEQLCNEVIELDKKATKGPWEDDEWSSFIRAYFDGKSEHLQEHQIIAIVDRDNLNLPERLVPWGDQQDKNRELMVHYRTSAPKLARACQIMWKGLKDECCCIHPDNCIHPEDRTCNACETLAEIEKIVGE